MASFAMVFPGQGSQSIGMCSDFAAQFPVVHETFAVASDICGKDIWAITQDGPLELLNDTTITQPAMLAADVAIWRCWESVGGPRPSVVAGHSLGEYAALVCAGVLTLESAMKLVHKRATAMASAQPAGMGGVGVIIGFEQPQVEAWCAEVNTPDSPVSLANINSPKQLVIAGEKTAVETVLAKATEAKARIARLIPVSVPVHCDLMRGAADLLAPDLAQATFNTPEMPVIFNVDATQKNDATAIEQALVAQLFSPVQWLKTMEAIIALAPETIVESGPGSVLAGLFKRTYRKAPFSVLALNAVEQLPKEFSHV
jgi:[acyl-carrier-protein] S-malonyltransferase